MRVARRVLVYANEHALVRRGIPVRERLARQIRRAEQNGGRLSFVFERREVMPGVFHDRSSERSTDLLVLIRKTASCDGVRRVERIITKVAVDGARARVRARFRDGLHLHTSRSSLGDVEHAGDDLELRDSLAAELWLSHNRERSVVRHLLAIEVQLKR